MILLLKLPFMLYDHSRALNIIILKINVTTKGTFRRESESCLNIKRKELYCQIKNGFLYYIQMVFIFISKKVKSIVI